MLDFPMPRLLGYARETAIAEKFQAILALGRANSRMKDVYDILDSQLTTRVIADALEKEGYFFSSSRASPVICVVGMTVLDIMRDEGLQENARMVGDHLRRPLEALGQRFPRSAPCMAWASIWGWNSCAIARPWRRPRAKRRPYATGCCSSA